MATYHPLPGYTDYNPASLDRKGNAREERAYREIETFEEQEKGMDVNKLILTLTLTASVLLLIVLMLMYLVSKHPESLKTLKTLGTQLTG